MKRTLCAIVIAIWSFFAPPARVHADESPVKEEKPVEPEEISSEDRQVIRSMDLLALMELLKDMDLLEEKPPAVSEDKK